MPLSALAQSASSLNFNEIDLSRYNDSPWSREVDLAVSVLTEEGILFGNDDGTFSPHRTLNRAEFMQIAMRLLPPDTGAVRRNCFPDVPPDSWYSDPICRAKVLGIVRGNVKQGVSPDLWRFEPSRYVQYEEAVKVLTQIYAMPISGDTEGNDWYVPYIQTAVNMHLNVPGLQAGDRITRGEMARLTVAFLAESVGQLEEYRDAERETSSSSSSRTSSSSSRSSSSSSSSRSSMGSGQFDPDDDRTIRSSVLLVGETSPVLAGVKFFSNNEPVNVDRITVELMSDVDSVQNLVIYTAEGELLGTATEQSPGVFQATIPSGRFELPRREDESIYIRARLNNENTGGIGNETVQVDRVMLRGTGVWSNDEYNTTSTGSFESFVTSLGVITSIASTGPASGALTEGSGQQLGQFRFEAESVSGSNDVRLTQLQFQIEQTGGVTLSNVKLRSEGGIESSCTTSSTTVTCSSIPSTIGDIDPSQTLRVYGDVTVPSGTDNMFLRLTLNEPGTMSSAGSITWTDGTTTFTWVPMDQPVAQGTRFE